MKENQSTGEDGGAKEMSALVGSGTKLKREEDVCPCKHRKCYKDVVARVVPVMPSIF